MPRLPVMRSKDFLKSLIAFGCEEISVNGSHHKVVYPATGKVAPVPVHKGEDMNRGFLAGILAQLGIDVDEFLKFIK
jgi:predicted RNA binding protein YcfA (HicA-like mRNA interferase family)